MTLVSADHKLARLGRARCLLIPRLGPGQSAGFHLVLRVDANAPPGPVDNMADVTPRPEPPGSPGAPEVPVADLPPGGSPAPPGTAVGTPARAKAKVKVLATRVPRRGQRPRFTG
jgi:hypothetical protein